LTDESSRKRRLKLSDRYDSVILSEAKNLLFGLQGNRNEKADSSGTACPQNDDKEKMIRMKFTTTFLVLLLLMLHQPSNAQHGRDVIQLFEAVGARAGSKLGYQVAGLGDQNGDGFDDILASAPGDRKAFIYFGGNPMDTIPDMAFYKEDENLFGCRLCNLGDINGDSFADFAIGSVELVRVYMGGAELDTLADLILPYAYMICGAGDVNGDGYDDILRSDINWQSSRGKATLYFGGEEPDSIADWSAVGDSAWYYFGGGIAGNGDVNGDDYDDIAISGWRWIESTAYSYIKIYYGGAEMDTIPDLVMDSFEEPLDISTRVAFIDVNGDDFSDLCVDASRDTSALLFYGSILPDITPDLTLQGSPLSGKMWEISEAGDINNDNFLDIIIGNYDGWNNTGEVLVFLGEPYMDGKYDIGFTGFMHSYEGAGRSVGKAGDVNGDGVDDILFGAWVDYGDNKQGRVTIFSGDTTLTAISADPPTASQPHFFSLRQNYPNPFNEATVIEYQISTARPTRTKIKIYNVLGEEVTTLVDEPRESGHYQVIWNGEDKFGREVGSGIYFCQLKVENFHQTRKLLLIR